jgi:hypothetical protein
MEKRSHGKPFKFVLLLTVHPAMQRLNPNVEVTK